MSGKKKMKPDLKLSMPNPFGRDLLPLDLRIDPVWLKKEMKRTGKPAHECISDHLVEAFGRSLRFISDINRRGI